MVGCRNMRYGRFGWAAARTDDLVHWLPARLSVLDGADLRRALWLVGTASALAVPVAMGLLMLVLG
jgi:cobalamin biosynthesis protein CobD/CbiB